MLKKWLICCGTLLAVSLLGGDDWVKDAVLYQNDFDSAESFTEKNKPAFIPGGGAAGDGAFAVTGYNASHFLILPLDPQKFNGIIILEAVVKAENISVAEKAHEGAKVMLVVKDKNGKTWYYEPGMLKRSGSCDWQTISMVKAIPEGAESVEFYFGIQKATGKFFIDSLSIYQGKKK